jgi:GNAT superfamily N-acetyltransferase
MTHDENTMKHFSHIGTFENQDVVRMALADLENAHLWDQITLRQQFIGSDHKDTETVYLRGPREWTAEAYMGLDNAMDYVGNLDAMPALEALVGAALDAVAPVSEVGYVMAVKLKAGGVVTPHIDEGQYAEHFTRFHLVLTTNDGCLFRVGDEEVHMPVGSIWQFDHRARHTFVNNGKTDRIHVIFDAVPRPGLRVCISGRDSATIRPALEIRESTVDEMLTLAPVLFQEHWEEIALNKQVMVLKPNEPVYRAMEQEGRMLILGAYRGGELIGYSVNFMANHPHYADLVVCQNDLLFIAREHRKGVLGVKLIKATEAAGKARGAQLMLWHAKEGSPLAAIMPRMGCKVQDIIFSKGL